MGAFSGNPRASGRCVSDRGHRSAVAGKSGSQRGCQAALLKVGNRSAVGQEGGARTKP